MSDPHREPGLINKVYRDPRRGMIFGVCAGFAEYFGFVVTVTRVIVAVSAFFALLPVRAYSGPQPRERDPVERQVRAAPHDTLANVRYRFRDLDVRLQRLEKYVTSNRYKLEREFSKLEE